MSNFDRDGQLRAPSAESAARGAMTDADAPPSSRAVDAGSGFDAFVSYSRRDSDFCAILERHLRAYKPPSGLNLPQRRLSVFRDMNDLIGADYFTSIDGYLRGSKKLILVCSPQARESDYVNDEIRRFVDTRGGSNIIPIIVAGMPNNEARPEDRSVMASPDALCSTTGDLTARSINSTAAPTRQAGTPGGLAPLRRLLFALAVALTRRRDADLHLAAKAGTTSQRSHADDRAIGATRRDEHRHGYKEEATAGNSR
jgi:TIR domain